MATFEGKNLNVYCERCDTMTKHVKEGDLWVCTSGCCDRNVYNPYPRDGGYVRWMRKHGDH